MNVKIIISHNEKVEDLILEKTDTVLELRNCIEYRYIVPQNSPYDLIYKGNVIKDQGIPLFRLSESPYITITLVLHVIPNNNNSFDINTPEAQKQIKILMSKGIQEKDAINCLIESNGMLEDAIRLAHCRIQTRESGQFQKSPPPQPSPSSIPLPEPSQEEQERMIKELCLLGIPKEHVIRSLRKNKWDIRHSSTELLSLIPKGEAHRIISPAIKGLMDMGFEEDVARAALEKAGGNSRRALDFLV
jgi:hypothetical protein